MRGSGQEPRVRHGRRGTREPVPPAAAEDRKGVGVRGPMSGKTPYDRLGIRLESEALCFVTAFVLISPLFTDGMQLDRDGVRRGRKHVSLGVRGVCRIGRRRLPGPLRLVRFHRAQRPTVLSRDRGELPRAASARVSGHHAARGLLPQVRRSSAHTVQVRLEFVVRRNVLRIKGLDDTGVFILFNFFYFFSKRVLCE